MYLDSVDFRYKRHDYVERGRTDGRTNERTQLSSDTSGLIAGDAARQVYGRRQGYGWRW